MREMVGGCCVCSDDRGWSENPLVYCDGQSCTVAVHQACYGIVTVPTGPWYCRKCESQERSVKVKCELCPSKYGALKRTDNQGWAHVVCALYIPEVRFGNVTTMEPIQLQLIPAERFSKVCYICEEKGKPANASVGACMQCNKAGCRQQFHVTCAQGLGLLCEEAGNYLDNVKYCGYCQHHYSKLKKGGNVKTIPPYKPVANEAHNSDSSSEKEGTPSKAANPSPPTAASKKKTTANAKTVPSKSSNKSQSKPVNNNAKNAEKGKATNAKSGKTEELEKNGDSEPKESRDTKGAKKRKANSRAPTPVGVAGSEVSVVVNPVTSAGLVAGGGNSNLNSVGDKGGVAGSESAVDKKKAKIETTQSIITNQPVVALTSISAPKPSSAPLPSAPADPTATPPDTVSIPPAPPLPLPPTIIQTTQAQSHSQSQLQAQAHSLVVSVPLVNASLSPLGPIVCNQTSVVTATPSASERSGSVGCSEKGASVISSEVMTGGNSNQGLLTSDMNTGGLKITYEKQMDSINTEVDMELELEPSPSRTVEVPAKRGRSQSQSNEKTDRSSRSRKRNGSSATCPAPSSIVETHTKRASRSQHVTPPPMPLPLTGSEPPGAFAAISQAQMKESPPSSPSSESQSNPPSTRGRTRGRKSAPAAVNVGSGSSKDSKDVKIFQNGMSAPHMLGNQLNPNSTMHSKMNDHLNNEIEAHSIFSANDQLGTSLTGPQLHHKVLQQARASSTSSSTTSGGSGLSSMLGGGGGTIPQTLDQLLERQWEQGSQFLMEQAQHFDIASLLSCLHQLRAENLRLEEHVSSLLQRRDHLLAVNARLAIPLTNQPAAAPISTHPHQINNVHPSVAASHADATRSARHNGSTAPYPSHPQGTSAQHAAPENGLPPDPYGQSHPHRSPAGSQQSPNVRW